MDNKIKDLRVSKNMNQETFANTFGVSQQTVSRIEKKPLTMTIDMLLKMADFFHVSTDYVLGLSDERQNSQIVNQITRKVEEQYEMLDKFEKLSDVHQRIVLYTINELLESEKAE